MLSYVRAVRKEVERALRQGTAAAGLSVDERKSEGQLVLQLRDDHNIYLADGHGIPWILHPLSVQPQSAREYLFGLQVVFTGPRERDQVLISAAMMLAVRIAAADSPTPLVRAEWDAQGVVDHAQPHWHIYPRPAAQVELNLAEAPELNGGDLQSLFWRTGGIHWAMAADWFVHAHAARAYEYDFKTIDSLANWLGGCLGYVRKQLEYIETKLPARKNYFEQITAGR
ncbi:MAG: hypothetical protein ACT4P4_23215 [Betaproteobacteria bacterium]